MRLCDHCESSMDDAVRGRHGDYCSHECHIVEENADHRAHHTTDPWECPGCFGGDSLTIEVDGEGMEAER